MTPRIAFYSFLSMLWIAVALAIFFGLHERIPWMGQADEWKKYLAIGICLLMSCFNVLRIYLIRQAAARNKQPHDKVF